MLLNFFTDSVFQHVASSLESFQASTQAHSSYLSRDVCIAVPAPSGVPFCHCHLQGNLMGHIRVCNLQSCEPVSPLPSLMPGDVVATFLGISAFHHVDSGTKPPNNISQTIPLLRNSPSLSQLLHRHLWWCDLNSGKMKRIRQQVTGCAFLSTEPS